MSNLSPKTRARNLQKALQEHFNQPVKLSQAYELIAQEEGFKNWDTAAAKIPVQAHSDWTSPKLLPWKTIYNFWQEDGFSLDKIFKNQPSAEVWLNEISKSLSLTVITGRSGSGRLSLAKEMLFRRPHKYHAILDECCSSRDGSEQSMTFSKAVSAAMRSAPEVVFIGELRNMEHLSMAVTLIKTGHNVVATLRSNYERPLHESLAEAIPGCVGTEELEGFQQYAGWNQHHVHIHAEWSISSVHNPLAKREITTLYR